jgi:hypothetical protein
MANVTVKYNGEVMRNMLMTYADAYSLSAQLLNKENAEVIISAA